MMELFVVKAPVIGSVGPQSQWQTGPPCPVCQRSSRTYAPLHFILNRWDNHDVSRLTWNLLLADGLVTEMAHSAGIHLIARDIIQEENLADTMTDGTAVPQFKLIEMEAIVPNRLSRFCSGCHVSMKGDSQYMRLAPAGGGSTANVAGNESGAVLFDTDVPADVPVFSIGREMIAITKALVPFFEHQPEVRLFPVPIMPNPLPPNLSPPKPEAPAELDW